MKSEYDKNDDELVERYKNENLEILFLNIETNIIIIENFNLEELWRH